MENDKISLTVVMPALNEENNIEFAIKNTLNAFNESKISGEIIVINDGSSDRTKELVENFIKKENRIKLISHTSAKGIGASFWDGVDNAKGAAVVMIPGDNENDSWEIFRYHKLLEHVDIVIPFIFNRQARSAFRNVLSLIYRIIINTTFMVNFNYTNGTVIYRKSILKELNYRSDGFFFQTDILIRTVKRGYLFAEVPYRLDRRKKGASKALSFPSLVRVIKGYLRLVRGQYFKQHKNSELFCEDSITAKRRQNLYL